MTRDFEANSTTLNPETLCPSMSLEQKAVHSHSNSRLPGRTASAPPCQSHPKAPTWPPWSTPGCSRNPFRSSQSTALRRCRAATPDPECRVMSGYQVGRTVRKLRVYWVWCCFLRILCMTCMYNIYIYTYAYIYTYCSVHIIYICIYMYVHINIIHIYIPHTHCYLRIHLYTNIPICIIYIYICIYIQTYIVDLHTHTHTYMHAYIHTHIRRHIHIHPEPRAPKQRRPQDLKDPPTLLHESIKPSAFLRSINLVAFRSPCRSCSHFSGLKPHFTELFSFSSIRASKRNKTSSVSPSQARKSVKSFARPSCM